MKLQYLPALIGAAFATQLEAAKVIPNNATANLVLGQQDFVSAVFPSVFTSFRMGFPDSVVVDPVTRKVFVGDGEGDRILRYANISSLVNGAPAEAVFGADTFSDGNGGSTQTRFFDPTALFLDRFGRLWSADPDNNRVLCFEAAAFRGDLPSADFVFGQPNFTTITSGVTAAKMSGPTGVCVDSADNLWVADSGNNRVLKFATVTNKSSGANADSVLGQANFTTATAGTGNTGLQNPVSVAISSSGTLYVTCQAAHRIMLFNNASSLGSNPPAAKVFGQPDFATTSSGISDSKFNTPAGCTITPDDSLWVTDRNNNRLLRFSQISSKQNGSPADGVVGQADFVLNASGTTSQALSAPTGSPAVDSTGSLWIADGSNHRVLRFAPDTKKPTLVVTSNVPGSTAKAKLTIKGTANDNSSVSKVQFQVNGGTAKDATGTTTWEFKASLKPGKNTIKIFAVDSVGNKSVIKSLKVTRS